MVACSWWSDKLSDNEFLDRRPNAKYLFVWVGVENLDEKARMIPPLTLVDANGAEYEADSHGWAVKDSIGLIESLNPGVSKKGLVVFDVPEDREYRIRLSGGFWSIKDAYVELQPKHSREVAFQTAINNIKRMESYRDKAKGISIPEGATAEEVTEKLNQRIDDLEKAEQKERDERETAEQEKAAARFKETLERVAAQSARWAAEEKAKKERKAADEAAKWRVWTDSAGLKFRAKFGGLASRWVLLEKEDGSKVRVFVDDLSAEDREWIDNRKR
jgi:hypothetical protein